MANIVEPEEPARQLSWAMRNHSTWTDFLYRRYEQELQRREWIDRSASMLLGLSTFIIAGSATVLGTWITESGNTPPMLSRVFLLIAVLLALAAIVNLLLMLGNRGLTMTLGTYDVRNIVQSIQDHLRSHGGTSLNEPGVLGANLALDGLEQSIKENVDSNDRASKRNHTALRLLLFGSTAAAIAIVGLLGHPILQDLLQVIGCWNG